MSKEIKVGRIYTLDITKPWELLRLVEILEVDFKTGDVLGLFVLLHEGTLEEKTLEGTRRISFNRRHWTAREFQIKEVLDADKT